MQYLFFTAGLGILLLAAIPRALAQATSPRLEDLTHPEVRARSIEVAVLPIGSVEPHANHLPYGTDAWAANIMAERVAAKANQMGAKVLVLPTMPYGINSNQAPNPYAQSIRPPTMMQFVKDVVSNCEMQGIRKVVILNGHGGNTTTLGATLRELFASNPKVFVAMVETWTPFAKEAAQIIETRGEFTCSNPLLNAIHECARRSTLYNYHGFPTDCPQRERNGWTGDGAGPFQFRHGHRLPQVDGGLPRLPETKRPAPRHRSHRRVGLQVRERARLGQRGTPYPLVPVRVPRRCGDPR